MSELDFPGRKPDIVVRSDHGGELYYNIWLTEKEDEFLYEVDGSGFASPSSLYVIKDKLFWSHENDRETCQSWKEDTIDDESERDILEAIARVKAEIEDALLR